MECVQYSLFFLLIVQSLMIMAAIAIVFPLLAILVKNYWYVLTMRGILGLSLGFASAVCPMYSSAIVDDSVKGVLLMFVSS